MRFRTRTVAAIAASAVLLLGADAAGAQTGSTPAQQCATGAKQFRALAKDAYDIDGWRQGPKPEAVDRAHEALACAGTRKLRRKERRTLKDARSLFKTYVRYRHVAHEPGFHGEGIWLEWLVIPRWVVAAETNGYHGNGRWRARNGSGACGPYQLLGWTSCDTSSPQDKLRHHIVASRLPRGSWAVGYSLGPATVEEIADVLAEPDVYWWDQRTVDAATR